MSAECGTYGLSASHLPERSIIERMALLEVHDLRLSLGGVPILRGMTFSLAQGRTLGIVGESGCGKSLTGYTLMGMAPEHARVTGSVRLEGRELLGLAEREWNQLRGAEVGMVFQDPFTSLNPMMRVGEQIAETYRLHQGMNRRGAWDAAVRMLDHVGVPEPATSARKYPHQMSGGQRQRVVIGIAFAGRPKVLIADEPTTALDVTLQAQILRLLRQLQEEAGTAVMLISHDIGVIAACSDEIAVVYAGRIVEQGPGPRVLNQPQHPYTQALLDALPDPARMRLTAIPGQPPLFADLGPGCAFAPRCPRRFDRCEQDPALLGVGPNHHAACWAATLPAIPSDQLS